MSTQRRRPLLRTAAVSALVGGALLFPVAGAFADAPAPKPRGEAFEVTLGNSAKARILNRGGSYAATVSLDGKEVAALSATHPTATQDGVRYELHSRNGHIGIAYLNGQDGKGGEKEQREQKVSPPPEGGVAAGAQGVRDAGDPAFLVAGGGMAAAGAAGLGFAMLRRGRTDS